MADEVKELAGKATQATGEIESLTGITPVCAGPRHARRDIQVPLAPSVSAPCFRVSAALARPRAPCGRAVPFGDNRARPHRLYGAGRCVANCATHRTPTSYYAPSLRSPWRAANALVDGVNDSATLSLARPSRSVNGVETAPGVLAGSLGAAHEASNRVHQIAAAAEEQSAVAGEVAKNLSETTTSLPRESGEVDAVNERVRAERRPRAPN